MREIGLALGVVESRVSQVHASAVVHLRAALKDLASRTGMESRRVARPPASRRAVSRESPPMGMAQLKQSEAG